MSNGAYSADKALAHPYRLRILQSGGQPYPAHLHLIISDLCNLSCGFCAYRLPGYSSNKLFGIIDPVTNAVNNNPNRMLDLDLIKSILDDCVEMGVKAVEFTGGGEPTVHPALNQILTYAQTIGLETALITNGILLHKVSALAISKLKWLRISIDAATPDTFAKVRPYVGGPKGEALFTVLEALSKTAKVLKTFKSDCVLGAGFVVQKDNWQEMLAATRLYKEHGAQNIRISGVFTPEMGAHFIGWREQAEALEKEAIRLFDGKDGYRVYGRFHEKVEDVSAPPDYSFCGYQNFTTYIGGDGNLYRCCVTSYNEQGLIGNIREAGGFRKLWDSQQKKDKFKSFDARSCQMCQFNDRNKAIASALNEKVLPAADPNLIHANFV